MIVPASKQQLKRAAEVIRAGGVVAYPTETLYGLAVDALSEDALQHLLDVKQRQATHSVPILISDRSMLRRVVSGLPPLAGELMDRHWPGPLTLILPAAVGIPAPLVGPGGGVGVRISADPVATELVARCERPITATSANLTTEPPATRAAEADLPGITMVLDDGPRQEQASTVVSLLQPTPVVLRQGAVWIS